MVTKARTARIKSS